MVRNIDRINNVRLLVVVVVVVRVRVIKKLDGAPHLVQRVRGNHQAAAAAVVIVDHHHHHQRMKKRLL